MVERISVVMAVRDGGAFIKQALDSIFSQTTPSFEVLVIDDGSTDETADIVATFPAVQLLRQQNRGQPAAMNRGITMAKGDFLAFLDADDLWSEEKSSWQLACFRAQPSLRCVFGWAEQFIDRSLEGLTVPGDKQKLSAQVPGAALIRRECFEMVGLFDERLRIGAAIEWYARAVRQGIALQVLPQVVLHRRIHAGNLRKQTVQSDAYFDVVRAVLARERPQSG